MDFFTYEKAKKKVKAKKKFYQHVSTWLVMSIFFILLNVFTSDHFWAIFPILGWGLGLALHGLKVFSFSFGEDWEEKELQKELKKMERQSAKAKYLSPHVSDRETMPELREKLNESDFV